jgi:hypothetical protein
LVVINAGVANDKEEVPLFQDLGPLLQHLVPATGASQVPLFPLTRRARSVRTAEDIEKVQATLPHFGEPIVCAQGRGFGPLQGTVEAALRAREAKRLARAKRLRRTR